MKPLRLQGPVQAKSTLPSIPRRQLCFRIAPLAAMLEGQTAIVGQVHGAKEALTIPFRFASGRGSILIQARVTGKAALLMLDTGSSHTILMPSIAGVNRADLALPRTDAGIIGDAVAREVTLEIGECVFHRHRVSVMDLSNALSAYREKIDGLLGIEFLLRFSQATFDLKTRSITFIP